MNLTELFVSAKTSTVPAFLRQLATAIDAADTTPPPPDPPTTPTGSDMIDVAQATILNSPPSLASWPITTKLEVVDLGREGIALQFSKKDGAGRWPDITPPGWAGPLQYTLGMCLKIGGKWYASACIQFWYGLERSGGPPDEYAKNWFYDGNRWAPMTGHQPAVGEEIGIFVVAGNGRNVTDDGSQSPVKERSNVVLVRQPSNGGAVYRF